jgi:hypothetical protein
LLKGFNKGHKASPRGGHQASKEEGAKAKERDTPKQGVHKPRQRGARIKELQSKLEKSLLLYQVPLFHFLIVAFA